MLQCQWLHYRVGTVASSFSGSTTHSSRRCRGSNEAAAREEALSQRWRKEANRTIRACQGTSCDSVLLPVVLPVPHPDVSLPCVCVCLVFSVMAKEQLGNHQHHHLSSLSLPSLQLNKSQASVSNRSTIPKNATMVPIHHTFHRLVSNNKRKICLRVIHQSAPGASVFWKYFYNFGSLSSGWCQYVRFTLM